MVVLLLLGVDDGCYKDWSLDLLVARKVGEVPLMWLLWSIQCFFAECMHICLFIWFFIFQSKDFGNQQASQVSSIYNS